MKRFIVLLILAIPICAYGWMGVISLGGGVTESITISDDFSDADTITTNWTQDVGTWTVTTETLVSPNIASLITHDTELDGLSQWVVAKLVTANALAYPGLYFRYDGNTSNYAYTFRQAGNSGNWQFRAIQGTSSTVITSDKAFVVTPGDYVGIEIEGTDSGTILRAYDFGSTGPANREDSLWNSATATWTDADWTGGYAAAANVGKYVGILSATTLITSWDDFSAGTF